MTYQMIVSFFVNSVGALGYFGIFIFMFLESSFFPFPSEIVMIPAGYLVYQGRMDLLLIIGIGILGSIAGAWLNYFLADRFGRRLLLRFLKEHRLKMVENFFKRHGNIAIFNGRLIPVVRQYISFPAGLAKMNPLRFTLYTGFGAGIWIMVLVFLGYFFGQNEILIRKYLMIITILILIGILLFMAIYVYYIKRIHRNKRRRYVSVFKNVSC